MNKKMANKLRNVADQIMVKAYDFARNGDKILSQQYTADTAQMKELADLVESGEWSRATRVAFSMESVLRERIPDDIWEVFKIAQNYLD